MSDQLVFSVQKSKEYYFLYVNGHLEGCYTLTEVNTKILQLISFLTEE
ncbi:MAG: hypothetical protein J6S67_10445 [Methanobrevibacter sp.]|nr:hypothetical protein [Methanobrevibacter sp.]